MPTSYWLKFGNTPLGYNGSGVQFTHVEQPGTLTVSLVGTGTGFDTTKNFNVLVTFGSAISYTVDGIPVATPSDTCVLTLHAGQSSVIGNIPFGTTFVISETITDEGYELQSITVPSGTMTDGGAIQSVVNNVYYAPGTITVTNSVTIGGSGFDNTKLFGVTITFDRAVSYTVDGTPVSTPSSTCSLLLANEQSSVVGNIPYNTAYTISEVPMTSAEISAGYTNGIVTNASGTMPSSGTISSTANYIYEQPNTAVINGKRYRTTTIDGKVWLAENYTYAVGSANPGGTPTTAAYWDYADSVLYNIYAVRQIIANPPSGWHIPTQTEWESLATYVGYTASKIKSTSGWRTDTGYGNGTDDYGFDGKPLGMRSSGSNMGASSEACWWTSTEVTSSKFAEVDLIYYSDAIRILTTMADGTGAYSIRLIKDY